MVWSGVARTSHFHLDVSGGIGRANLGDLKVEEGGGRPKGARVLFKRVLS